MNQLELLAGFPRTMQNQKVELELEFSIWIRLDGDRVNENVKNIHQEEHMGPGQEKIDALNARMVRQGIRKEDIQERFIKSSGRGGQKVNKTSSAVFLRHLPTGIAVKCGKTRSQALNRFLALRRLVEAVEKFHTGAPSVGDIRQAKIRKQKKKSRRRAAAKYKDLSSDAT
jgi:protein subunit release factor B